MPARTTLAFTAAAVVASMWTDAGADRARCVPPGSPSIERARAGAAAWTRASFERALARRGLRALALPTRRITLHRGYGPSPSASTKALPFDKATATELDGTRGVFIGGVSEWSGNGSQQPLWELVINSRREVFRVRRAPRSTSRAIAVCGCQPQRCGPYGSGCPACGSTGQVVYGPLPAGAVYRGELEVRYPARVVTERFVRTRGCQVRRCPPPPPSMNRGP